MTANIKVFGVESSVDLPSCIAALNIIIAAQIAAVYSVTNLTSFKCEGFAATNSTGDTTGTYTGQVSTVLSWVTP